MTTRIRVLPYGPSDSVNALVSSLNQHLRDNRINANAMALLSDGTSRFRARSGDVIINYGNRRYQESFFEGATVLNNVAALNRAANKVAAFNTMRLAEVKTVEYTTNREEAQNWNRNSIVYERGVLNGHSGEGITVRLTREGIAEAPLYTKAITGPRREWRVHVFEGVITYVQKKIRRNGYRDNPDYREDVRNHHTGWVYSNAFNDSPNDQVLIQAHKAVQALGLNFGAVDLISKGEEAWVLEVNTAPGLTGTTLETYQHNFLQYVESLRGQNPEYRVAYPLPVIQETVELEDDTEEADDENFALAGDTPTVEPVVEEVPEVMQAETTAPNARHISEHANLTRGYYLANINHPDRNYGRMASNVVVFFCGRNFYRSGWNTPISCEQVGRVRRLASVTTVNGEVVNF